MSGLFLIQKEPFGVLFSLFNGDEGNAGDAGGGGNGAFDLHRLDFEIFGFDREGDVGFASDGEILINGQNIGVFGADAT